MINIAKHKRENYEFPQLCDIADPVKLASMLEHYLAPSSGSDVIQIDECGINELYYKPGHNCRMVLSAKLHRQNSPQSGGQVFFGKLFHSSQCAQEVFDSLNRENLVQPEFGSAVVYIPEWQMIIWAHPNDPNLPGLPVMIDAKRILAFAQAAPEKFGLNQPPVSATATMVRYAPGKRCSFIYHLTLNAAGSDHLRTVWSVYGKAYSENEGAKAYAVVKQIWDSKARRNGQLALPQPYSYDPDLQILWQEAFPGQPFAKVEKNIPRLPEAAKEIGVRLAALHGLHLQLPLRITLDFQIKEMGQAVAAISKSFPAYAQPCMAVCQRLIDTAAELGPGAVTPVHASFKFSHIFATNGGFAFIDFDGMRLGEPGYDVGRFIAHVYRMKAASWISAELAEQTVMNFCESYNRAAALPLPWERINWFAATHVISSELNKSVKRMNPRLVSELLKIAHNLCPA